jgi:hypothetical protein
MSQGQYSSVMLIATDGLLQNQGFVISGNLTVAIASYNSTDAVGEYLGILGTAIGNVGVANNEITSNTFSALQTLAANTFPAITDAVPSNYAGNIAIGNTAGGFSGLVSAQAQLVLGSGDISQFLQTYNLCQSYISQNNPIINTVKNSDVIAPTFTNMNSLSTGGISDVNRVLPVFAADLRKLGQTWDLTNLLFFGFPSALLYQLAKAGGILPELTEKMTELGITSDQQTELATGAGVTSQVEELVYKAMTQITGSALDQVKIILDVTTSGISTMADLLNPVSTLPDSYLQLTIQAPTVTTAWGSQWNLLRSQSVRLVLAEYAGFQNLYLKNGRAYILEYGHNNTPPKIQKCRSCNGLGKQKAWCTPVTCWNDPCKYPDRPVLNANKYRNWHEHSCEHGNHKMHKIYTENDCYRCGSVGKADYGSKPIAMMWDGSPLRIKHGQIINNQPTELEKAIAAYVKTG